MISGLFTNIVTRLSYTPHQELTTKNSVHTLPVSYIFLQWFQLSTGGCCLIWHLKRQQRVRRINIQILRFLGFGETNRETNSQGASERLVCTRGRLVANDEKKFVVTTYFRHEIVSYRGRALVMASWLTRIRRSRQFFELTLFPFHTPLVFAA